MWDSKFLLITEKYLLDKSGEYLDNCQLFEAGTTFIGAGLSATNETAGRLTEKPVQILGAASRTLEKQRLVEKTLATANGGINVIRRARLIEEGFIHPKETQGIE